jgi:hypothetical protein
MGRRARRLAGRLAGRRPATEAGRPSGTDGAGGRGRRGACGPNGAGQTSCGGARSAARFPVRPSVRACVPSPIRPSYPVHRPILHPDRHGSAPVVDSVLLCRYALRGSSASRRARRPSHPARPPRHPPRGRAAGGAPACAARRSVARRSVARRSVASPAGRRAPGSSSGCCWASWRAERGAGGETVRAGPTPRNRARRTTPVRRSPPRLQSRHRCPTPPPRPA